MKTPLIAIRNFDVSVHGNRIFHNLSVDIYQGEITLLVGGSGSGKTVLMKILTGLIAPGMQFEIAGSVKIDGCEILKPFSMFAKRPPVGIVFQDYGLFENYSVDQNLDFAFAHSPFNIPYHQRKGVRMRLQQKLNLDPGIRVRYASGGQKRRIAVARTMAYNPEIVIYDEPTAGLDPQMTRTVARLIRDTHEGFAKKSSIVVTHQYEEFLPLVDRILFLDPIEQNIREVSAAEIEQLCREGRFQVPLAPLPKRGWAVACLGKGVSFLSQTTVYTLRFLSCLFSSAMRMLPLWKSPVWGIRFFFHYLRMVSLLSAILYVGMAGIIIGFVGGYFTFEFLPYKHITERLVKDDFLMALGYGLYRIIIPILAAILIAARCGAAVTSDLGNRVYLQEIDAMRSLGASPPAYLQTNIIYAFLIGVPLLTMITFLCAKVLCLAVYLFMDPNVSAVYADVVFHKKLRIGGAYFYRGTGWVIYKQLVCGFGIANICYYIGIRPKSSTRDISNDITRAIIWGTLFVLLTHLVFALLEFPDKG